MKDDVYDHFRSAAKDFGLEEWLPLMESSVLPAVALRPTLFESVRVQVGQNRMGGLPDVSDGFVWPSGPNGPLSFVAQIDLSSLPLTNLPDLPRRGLLAFFYDNRVWGFDPKHRGGFYIHYFDEPFENLRLATAPADSTLSQFHGICQFEIFKSCALDVHEMLSLPCDPLYLDLEIEYEEIYDDFVVSLGGMHRIGGFPVPIQNREMDLRCALVSNGVYCGTDNGSADPRASALASTRSEWRLLAQFDSETEYSNMMWGDLGRLYFWIKEQDLKERRFENCWMIMQCG